MADNKKSFLLYTDTYQTVKHLSNEQAGELFKHLLAYVNDENPQTNNPLIKIAFEPIKQALKRDLERYKNIVKKRSEAGKISAKKRKLKQQMSTNDESVQQTSTNSTVNDSVIVNDNVNDILLEKEEKELFKNWISYRKEIKKPIKSGKTKISLAKKIKSKGIEESKSVIEFSIENGYQGLFWENRKAANTTVNYEQVNHIMK